MAQRYGFFNAVMENGKADRTYKADDINDFFKGILSDGVFKLLDNALLVELGTGLSVNINTGKALVAQHWYYNDTIVNLPINSAHPTFKRYTTIVLRYDKSRRNITLATVDGTPTETPVAPALTQTEDIYELALANVLVVAGATELIDGSRVLIVDDLCSRGGTFYHSAKKLKELGAKEIYLYISHY